MSANLVEKMSSVEVTSAKTAMKPEEFEKSSEYANYFCEYAKLYHQKDMLEDVLRMRAYHSAIIGNPECFKDKVVLDVGSGTGVLAMWAAQAGAKKVYAIEATPMARHARTLVKANGLQNIVEVVESKVEDLELPEKVDIIVSEWMGYLLIRESMLDSVIYARDKFLKDGGALYPSHARMCWGAIANDYGYEENSAAFQDTLSDWERFLHTIKTNFNLDMSALTKEYESENREHFLHQAYYRNLRSDQVLGENDRTTHLDLNTVTVEELRIIRENFSIDIQFQGECTALGCWFVTDFNGGRDFPTKKTISLDTSPHVGETHWGQQILHLSQNLRVRMGDVIRVNTLIQRHKDNDRMVHCTMGVTHLPSSSGDAEDVPPLTIQPQKYHVQ